MISPSKGLYDSQKEGYNGVGWVASLQQHLEKESDIELALAFTMPHKAPKERRGNTIYYPIHIPPKSGLAKLCYYWYGYKEDVFNNSIKEPIKEIINDFKPDIIHIFGTESDLAYIVSETDIPCVIHIQGILSSVVEVYLPLGICSKDLHKITDVNEFWLRNGIIFNYSRMKLAAEREKQYFRNCTHFIGRTDYDKEITHMYNPEAQYYHIDEVLRPEFYNAAKWKYCGGKLQIVSTLSPTIYKGFDIVLRTAKVLKECGVDFEWNIIGIKAGHKIIRIIEKSTGLDSKDLNIRYLGIKNPGDIIDILKKSTMYVHPSYIDNSPNSLCEAQHIGVPTIATNVGGIPTIMDYRQEYMASPVAPHSLAARIVNLNNELKDGTYKNALTYVARERHCIEKIINDIKEAYRNIISNKKQEYDSNKI